MTRRQFGNVRTLRSGRYQARYTGPDGHQHKGPHTFATKADARLYLSKMEVRTRSGQWIDPSSGRVTLFEYANDWLAMKPNLQATTLGLYEGFLTNHILPDLGSVSLEDLRATRIRKWHADLSASDLADNTVAKIYRLLRQILETAVDDDLIPKNPCRIKRAGKENVTERRIPDLETVALLLDIVDDRFRAVFAVAAYMGLRFGEIAGLQRKHINPLKNTITVEQQLSTENGERVLRRPKTDAGYRTIEMPKLVTEMMETHMREFTNLEPGAFVFTTSNGRQLDRANFRKRVWKPAFQKVGMEDMTFHDLRHVAGTMNASSGVSTRALMARMGHSTIGASLLYQHDTSGDDSRIAAHIDEVMARKSSESIATI